MKSHTALLSIIAFTCTQTIDAFSPSLSSSVTTLKTTTTKLSYTFGENHNDDDNKNKNNKKSNNSESSQQNKKDEMIWLPSQHPDSANRIARLMKEQEGIDRFPQTLEDLQSLRSDIATLKNNLKWALYTDDIHRIMALRMAIEKKEREDPDLVYAKALQKIIDARDMRVHKKYETIKKYTEEAEMARKFIPRLNLEGLWVGNYGEHGSELVNITYSGDTLIATKVTGDKHVPRKEITFRADLGPKLDNDKSSKDTKPLAPIQLTGTMASKWGTGKLERYPGEGQVSAEGFKNEQFVEGQLIMFDGYFSFLWVPTKHHVFFSRPNPQLTLHLMRDIISEEDEVQNMKDHIGRCYEKDISDAFIRPKPVKESPEPFRRIHREIDLVSVMEEKDDGVIVDSPNPSFPFQFPIPPNPTTDASMGKNFKFWAVQKWRNYIDLVMKDADGFAGFNN
jgi:hypothetical protein